MMINNSGYFFGHPVYIFSFFWFSKMILSDALNLPISQLETQHVITSLV